MKDNERSTKATSVLPNFELAELQELALTTFLEAKNQELAKLMLTLSLVYNDFKDYMWFRQLFKDVLKEVDTTKKTSTLGQLNGMDEHCTRMQIANLLELLETIREYKQLFDCSEFKKILFYLDKRNKDLSRDWWMLVSLADSKDSDDKFYKTLMKIRHNGTYHYKQMESLYQGLKYYLEKESSTGYISMGDTLEKTRFYFGDAAIQFYHRKTTDEFGDKFKETFKEYTKKVNVLLRLMIEIYLKHILKI